jgi:hypothetical protein
MFSYELITNPLMHYTLVFPEVEWYGFDTTLWMGKYVTYRTMANFFRGWFGALLESDRFRCEIQKLKVCDSKISMAMGIHPRLGEASIFKVLAGQPEVLGLIARNL